MQSLKNSFINKMGSNQSSGEFIYTNAISIELTDENRNKSKLVRNPIGISVANLTKIDFIAATKHPKLEVRLFSSTNNLMTDLDVELICQANWPKIYELSIDSTKITRKSIEHMVKSQKAFGQIKLINCQLGLQGVNRLADINMDGLVKLQLHNIVLQMNLNEDFRVFSLKKSRILAYFHIVNMNLSNKWIRMFIDDILNQVQKLEKPISVKPWSQMTSLHLIKVKISNISCKYITRPTWTKMEVINLSENSITEDGLRHLAKGNWPKLREFNLQDSLIGVNAMKFLMKGNWKTLKEINISISVSWIGWHEDILKADWMKLTVASIKNMIIIRWIFKDYPAIFADKFGKNCQLRTK